ncbi:MAG TPA: NADH-quinone oxidoreductase subunit J [Vicinamibacterales bacterium]|nr:NADH-quinone oxidoreductase subunit J [Vicinamibacterales bacterium]
MTADVVAFWGLAVLLVGSALAVVLTRNLFHSVLWLALALTGTAGLFLLLEAEFLAAVQVLLYAGGVVTVVVFAIVVTERLVGERLSHTSRSVPLGAITAFGLLAGLVVSIAGAPLAGPAPAMPDDLTPELGYAVLTRHVLPFELLGVLLLVALLGAIYFARPED